MIVRLARTLNNHSVTLPCLTELIDTAPVDKPEVVEEVEEASISSKDLEEIESALEEIAEQKQLSIEKEELEDLKEDVEEYKEVRDTYLHLLRDRRPF